MSVKLMKKLIRSLSIVFCGRAPPHFAFPSRCPEVYGTSTYAITTTESCRERGSPAGWREAQRRCWRGGRSRDWETGRVVEPRPAPLPSAVHPPPTGLALPHPAVAHRSRHALGRESLVLVCYTHPQRHSGTPESRLVPRRPRSCNHRWHS